MLEMDRWRNAIDAYLARQISKMPPLKIDPTVGLRAEDSEDMDENQQMIIQAIKKSFKRIESKYGR